MAPPEINRVIMIDAECNGLAAQPFAVAATLTDPSGELDSIVYRCPIVGPVDPWVATHVLPGLRDVPVNCSSYQGLLTNLRDWCFRRTSTGEEIIAGHVVWPVEARLLLDMYPGEDIWQGPFPLVDVASLLLAFGHNPVSVDGYLRKHQLPIPQGSAHHPLYDVRAADLCLRHLLTSAKGERPRV